MVSYFRCTAGITVYALRSAGSRRCHLLAVTRDEMKNALDRGLVERGQYLGRTFRTPRLTCQGKRMKNPLKPEDCQS